MTTPSEILAAMNRPKHWDGWVPTFTRTGFRPFATDPGRVVSLDIAHGLAHTFRYGGQSDPVITVAEHVLLVAAIIETLWPGNPHLVKAGLIHDAVEAYLHDVQSPLRRHLYIQTPDMESPLGWNDNDSRVGRHIAREFGLDPDWLDAPEVRAADILGASYEQRDCKNLAGDWGLPPIPEAVAHLRLVFLPPEEAKRVLLDKMTELGLSR